MRGHRAHPVLAACGWGARRVRPPGESLSPGGGRRGASIYDEPRARKDDTRRKILAGAVLLLKVESGDFDLRTFKSWMEKALTREDDRKLFGLA